LVTKRIIPCLDIKEGRVVKGTNFINLRDAGSAVELAERYYNEGADELVFLDITASEEKRKTLLQLVVEVAAVIRIPFTVGGGISELNDIDKLLKAGSDKVSLNTSIVNHPELISSAAKQFGSQAIVAAVDIKKVENTHKVFVKGGKVETEKNGMLWCMECAERGAGEILLTSMDHDGTKDGYNNDFLKELCEKVNIPVIASGGAGNKKHFSDTFINTNVDACLAASLFHYNELSIGELKKYLYNKNINVRI
jgi:cyclase